MNLNKKKIIVLIIVVVIGALFFYNNKKNAEAAKANLNFTTSNDRAASINPDITLSKIPEAAVTVQNTNSDKHGVCQSIRATYQDIDEVKKVEKISIRFVNTHKKVDTIVYRLRFFYKDSNENEIANYLVYKENQNDEDILIEKSTYKKGKLYLKIEAALGEILYTEEGLNLGIDQDLFLHYENKRLKDIQGVSPLPGEKDFIECRY
jgi:thiol-disulfide isomerase/thioredoxin